MAYSVTGVRVTPDTGFHVDHRHTAEGAMDCAIEFMACGLKEVEIRDGRGNLRSLGELERTAAESGADERGVAERLAAL